MSHRILIAEDERILRENLCELLSDGGYDVTGAEDGEIALTELRASDFDLLITDLRMPRLDGISLLKRAIYECPQTYVLLCTAYASVDSAVDALRLGAYDYLLKPVVFEDLLQKVRNLLSARDLSTEVIRLRQQLQERTTTAGFIVESEPAKRVLSLVERVAPTGSTVLVTGESGTGKEVAARAIHAQSNLSELPFVPVNVAAISSEMVESQLFGHERGAFTGATARSDGVFRGARGGTVFLDEVGELPASAQVKLLRALENHEVLPVGGSRPVHVDFRLVAATNRDLEARVAEGAFREDLFYRLNVFRIELPPLRDRRADIPPLTRHFVRQHAASMARQPPVVSNEVMRLFLGYRWPGNIRELSNIIERAMILCGQSIEPGDLPSELRRDEDLPMALNEAVKAAERRHIEWVLKLAGNREEAARLLQVDRATLYRRLSKYGLS